MIATVSFQKVLVCTILLLVLLHNANSTNRNDKEGQSVRNLKDNHVKDLSNDNPGVSPAKLRIKRQSETDRNRYYPRTVPLPILVGGGGIGGFGSPIGGRGFGARSPNRGFGSRSFGARGFGGRGIGGLGRGIGGFGGRGRG